MKRSRLKRYTPLKARAGLSRNSRINRVRKGARADQVRRLDDLWRKCIRAMHDGRCAKTKCARSELLDCCHLIHRGGNTFMRWDLRNGVLLTRRWHNALDGRGPQADQEAFWRWFEAAYPGRRQWMRENRGVAGRMGQSLDDIEKDLISVLNTYTSRG